MANIILSNLPTYTGNTDGVYVVMNDSGNTTTYKVTKENLSGTSGSSGSSGTSGSSGSSGTSGSSGSSGTSGSSGSSGTSGSSGSSGTKNTKLLNHVPGSTTSGPNNVTAWSASYTSSGGALIVTAWINAYAPFVTGQWDYFLKRDGVTVDTAIFFFNQTSIHISLPPLCYVTSSETGSHTYSITLGNNLIVDNGDYCLMVVTES
jgi:hypothetical protein